MEEKKKGFRIVIYNEVAYFLAMVISGSAISLTTLSGFGTPLGVSLFFVLNKRVPLISIGQWSWIVNIIILASLILLVQQVHAYYFLSLLTTFLFGFSLDIFQNLFNHLIVIQTFCDRLICYGIGFLLLGWGIMLFMKCSMPMVAFDLFVREVSRVKELKLGVVKTAFDIFFLLLTIGSGLLFFGHLVGLGIGTVIIAFCTGFYIQNLEGFFNRTIEFRPLIFCKKPKQELDVQEQPDKAEVPPLDDAKSEA